VVENKREKGRVRERENNKERKREWGKCEGRGERERELSSNRV